ncbi:GDYXXLXY domain-containing protein [Pacificimonas sp. WHA3]|uniref:GDYXXLXY domain-containing protein n=1 Tax=Pacificimonas pallii TaxID=2827236 RepID=A0ABS6SBA0_9SPHN|nr:GDYXXLXY domain-containing protein [Pacificimonas pallii]MBV7255689.1 GDYXXLXY domain-containing protein [Pacificimonas pallii]
MTRILLFAVLVLPLLALAGSIGLREAELASAEEWVIPVTGFDPRDMLRGRYILYRYDQEIAGNVDMCRDGKCRLCLTGPAPDGTRLEIRDLPSAPCQTGIDWAASDLNMTALPPFAVSRDRDVRLPPRFSLSGRFFVPDADAAALETAVLDDQIAMSVRITPDGRVLNRRLVPRIAAPREETEK